MKKIGLTQRIVKEKNMVKLGIASLDGMNYSLRFSSYPYQFLQNLLSLAMILSI